MSTALPQRYTTGPLADIAHLTDCLDLPETVESTAERILTDAYQSDTYSVIGDSFASLAPACVYYAARIHHEPIKFKHFSAYSIKPTAEISRHYRDLCQSLDLPVPPQTPDTFVPVIADTLDAPTQLVTAVHELLDHATEDITGCDPSGVAAGAFYTVSTAADHPQWDYTQREIADAADVCVVTLRDRWHDLTAYTPEIEHLLPEPEPAPTDDDTSESEPAHTTPESQSEMTADDTHDSTAPAVVTVDGDTAGYQTQAEAMKGTIVTFIEEYGLLAQIEVPFTDSNCMKPTLVNDPSEVTGQFSATWEQIPTGHYVDTKRPGSEKRRRLDTLAESVDAELEIEW